LAEEAAAPGELSSELGRPARFEDPDQEPFSESVSRPNDLQTKAGRLVLLSDLSDDSSLHPVAQIAAGFKLLSEIPKSSVRQLFLPLTQRYIHRIQQLAATVDAIDLEPLNTRILSYLSKECARVASFSPDADSALAELSRSSSEQLGGYGQEQVLDSLTLRLSPTDGHMQTPCEDGLNSTQPGENRPTQKPLEDFLELVWSYPSSLTVRTTRNDKERWVRVLRRDGLVLLAMAPFRLEGLLDSAEVILPLGLTETDIKVKILFTAQIPTRHTGSLDSWKEAVHAGRTAARATRLGDTHAAERDWQRCAAHWIELGDNVRYRPSKRTGPFWNAHRQPCILVRAQRPIDCRSGCRAVNRRAAVNSSG